jgi:hypothetical protein
MSAIVTIAAGETISTPLDLKGSAVTMVIAPAEWTPANITFLVSIDGESYFDLADAASGIAILRALHPASAVTVDQSYTRFASYLKIRSGTRDNPIAQAADRTLTLATVKS